MDGEVIIGTKLDTKSFEMQIKEVEYQLEQLDYELSHAKELKLDNRTIQEYELKVEKLTNQLASLRQKQEDLNTTNLSGVTTQLNNIGNGVESVIKKVTRWGLAVFGIRSAYNFVRGSISTLSGYNEQMATDIEYIRFALASTLQPVIERIIQLAYTLLQYIGYIAKAWFGVNIFANASAKAFQKNNKAIAGSTSNTKKLNKELQKTLAGFDEMNVLQDNNSDNDTGGGGSAGGGVSAPSMDLSNWEDVEIPEWIQWIADNKDLVLGFFIELGLLIAGIKLAQFLMTLGVSASVIGGIIAIVGGLIIFIKGIIDYLKNPTWENFAKILAGIAVIAAGVFLIFGGFPALIVAIIGAVIALGLAIYKNWDDIKKTLGKVGAWINDNIIKPVANFFKGLWNGITNGVKGAVDGIKRFFNSIPSFFSGVVNKITGFFRNIGSAAGSVIAGAFKSVVNSVLRTIENILNTPIRTINTLISTINKLPGVNIGRLPTFYLPRLAKGGIVNMPGRGINYGGANIAERGAEGIIPLTDSQQMALLGEAIGRFITINANITNTMNGRVISREIQRVQNQSNFAMNR